MILADTSVWVQHLRQGETALVEALNRGAVLAHPFVIGEILLGSLKARADISAALRLLPSASSATDEETLGLIESARLFGRGIGYIDAHLLAAAKLSNARLWTHDVRLMAAAAELGVAYLPE
jgi:hypothetical protein